MTGTPTYLDLGGEDVYAVVHLPDGQSSSTGVLQLSPYGWDDLTSYRSRRAWALRLEAAGHPVLRFDWPGTGDSPGDPGDTDRLAAWRRATVAAARLLRDDLGCSRVAAVGIGIGGLIASLEGAELDDLVLWGTSARGAASVRELRATAALHGIDGQPVVDDDGVLWVNGHPLPPGLAAELSTVELASIATPTGGRALLLGRDGRPPDARLEAALRSGDRAVETADGVGWSDLLADPQFSRSPTTTADLVASWLAAGATGQRAQRDVIVPGRTHVDLGSGIHESVLTLAVPGGPLSAIRTDPVNEPAGLFVVLLNGGALRRIGPNRMYVDAARRWAAAGIGTVRVDLPGTGDSAGPDHWLPGDEVFYTAEMEAAMTATLDALAAQQPGSPLVAAGLCSGAYWSFVAAAQHERVTGAVLLNPRVLVWSPRQRADESSRELSKLRSAETWRNVLRGGSSFGKAARVAAAAARRAGGRLTDRLRRRPAAGELGVAADRLSSAGAEVLLVLTPGEPLRARLGTDPGLAALLVTPGVGRLLPDGPTDAHTMAPPDLRRGVERAVDEWLLARRPR
ncbi:MAG: alpha/beta hydrolase [Frankiaceae bacterium]|nr:alpha/beta hydrolase [Frankiaceae bacterium]